ncbi:hypothetical protein D3C80_1247980 [compost metagenome]
MLPLIPAQPSVVLNGLSAHIIQSKHPVFEGIVVPEFNPIIDHSNVPLVTILIVMNVETVSPDNKHPLFTP